MPTDITMHALLTKLHNPGVRTCRPLLQPAEHAPTVISKSHIVPQALRSGVRCGSQHMRYHHGILRNCGNCRSSTMLQMASFTIIRDCVRPVLFHRADLFRDHPDHHGLCYHLETRLDFRHLDWTVPGPL
jgi:hypothetical protein